MQYALLLFAGLTRFRLKRGVPSVLKVNEHLIQGIKPSGRMDPSLSRRRGSHDLRHFDLKGVVYYYEDSLEQLCRVWVGGSKGVVDIFVRFRGHRLDAHLDRRLLGLDLRGLSLSLTFCGRGGLFFLSLAELLLNLFRSRRYSHATYLLVLLLLD